MHPTCVYYFSYRLRQATNVFHQVVSPPFTRRTRPQASSSSPPRSQSHPPGPKVNTQATTCGVDYYPYRAGTSPDRTDSPSTRHLVDPARCNGSTLLESTTSRTPFEAARLKLLAGPSSPNDWCSRHDQGQEGDLLGLRPAQYQAPGPQQHASSGHQKVPHQQARTRTIMRPPTTSRSSRSICSASQASRITTKLPCLKSTIGSTLLSR